jgi:hypothetical protein
MRAIVVTDPTAGTAGMTFAALHQPEPAINDVIVEVHASCFTSGELTWPSADAVAAFNSTERTSGQAIIRVRP